MQILGYPSLFKFGANWLKIKFSFSASIKNDMVEKKKNIEKSVWKVLEEIELLLSNKTSAQIEKKLI